MGLIGRSPGTISRAAAPFLRRFYPPGSPIVLAICFACVIGIPWVAPGLLPTPMAEAAGTRLLGIRTGPHGDSLRVVLDLEGPAEPSFDPLSDARGWVAVLGGACPTKRAPRIDAPHRDVASIRADCDGRDLRIEILTRRPMEARSFLIPAGNGKPRRFVIDLRPAGGDAAAGEIAGEAAGIGGAPARTEPVAPVEAEPGPRRRGPWRIVLDPGHGGHDSGARRKGIEEKEVVLDVARRVAKVLEGTGGYEPKLSRTDDRFLGLRQRRILAEDAEADAFVSVHANAARGSQAIGVEVFFLSLGGASDQASSELARLENEADPGYVVEEDAALRDIPFGFDLRQSDTLLRSSRLAESVLTTLEKRKLSASRGVKQAGFAVLKSFQVPSILVEIGFLSNPTEAKRLKDPVHRQKVAEAIAAGITDYFDRFARSRAQADP